MLLTEAARGPSDSSSKPLLCTSEERSHLWNRVLGSKSATQILLPQIGSVGAQKVHEAILLLLVPSHRRPPARWRNCSPAQALDQLSHGATTAPTADHATAATPASAPPENNLRVSSLVMQTLKSAGETRPDGGDAFLHGNSVTRHMGQASRHIGYCPQAGALPGLLTGREVLRLYARLRGFPLSFQAAAVDDLLSRLDLQAYADRCAPGSWQLPGKAMPRMDLQLMGSRASSIRSRASPDIQTWRLPGWMCGASSAPCLSTTWLHGKASYDPMNPEGQAARACNRSCCWQLHRNTAVWEVPATAERVAVGCVRWTDSGLAGLLAW